MEKNKCLGRLTVLLFIFSALFLTAGCAPTGQRQHDTGFIPPDKNLLRVGVTTNSPPLIFRQGDKIVGLEADLARELAAYLGKSLRFLELKWEDQIPALLENRIDIIMSGMTITRLRKVRVAFALSYFESGQMALVRRKDAARYGTGLFSFATSSAIGAIRDTTGEFYVETQFSSVKRKLYTDPDEAVEDLIDKEIDMFIHDAPMILYLASVNEARGLTDLFVRLTKEPLAWAVRKDDVALLESANNFLRSFNETGQLSKIVKYWIPLAN
ncbi:MAG: transporter substrate-binding domain-containing protein [Deltaproteobacteria bacterium]|jgi:polar amino acid transport system substrate-binding protein|nr:transporter substrate-binding domain-containing protein [Deltaproteobacteria bacterium]